MYPSQSPIEIKNFQLQWTKIISHVGEYNQAHRVTKLHNVKDITMVNTQPNITLQNLDLTLCT